MDSYRTIDRESHGSIVVSRSEFVATVAPIKDESDAQLIIASQRAAHPKARHVASALVLGTDRQTTHSSDDGEPSGTAGRPILIALEGAELTFAVAIVVRYFGGTLLGAGNLTRTYRKAAVSAIDHAAIITMMPMTRFTLEASYPSAARLASDAQRFGWPLTNAHYEETVTFDLAVPPAAISEVRALADERGVLAIHEHRDPQYVAQPSTPD